MTPTPEQPTKLASQPFRVATVASMVPSATLATAVPGGVLLRAVPIAPGTGTCSTLTAM